MKRIGKVLLAFALVAAMLIPMALTTRAEAKSDFGRNDIVGDLQNSGLDEYGKLKEKKKQDEGEHVGDWIKDHTVPGNRNNDPATNDSGGSTMPGVNPGKNGNPADQVVAPQVRKEWADYAVGYVSYDNDEYNQHFVFSILIQKCTDIYFHYADGHVERADPTEEYQFASADKIEIVSGDETLAIESFLAKYNPVTNKSDSDIKVLDFKWQENVNPISYDEPTFPGDEPTDGPWNGEGSPVWEDDDIDHTADLPTGLQTIHGKVEVSLAGLLADPNTVVLNH